MAESKRVVVFVDVQNDFIGGALKNEKAIEITPRIVDFAKICVENGDVIYATRDTHDADYLDTLEGRKLPVKHCVEGTSGWCIDDRLMDVILGNSTIVNKNTFGSFDLAEIIDEDRRGDYIDGIETPNKYEIGEIVIVGFVSSICVAANAVILRAKFPNTKITVMKDLCAGISDEDHAAAMKVFEMQQIDII